MLKRVVSVLCKGTWLAIQIALLTSNNVSFAVETKKCPQMGLSTIEKWTNAPLIVPFTFANRGSIDREARPTSESEGPKLESFVVIRVLRAELLRTEMGKLGKGADCYGRCRAMI